MPLIADLDVSKNPELTGCDLDKFVGYLTAYGRIKKINLSDCSLFDLKAN